MEVIRTFEQLVDHLRVRGDRKRVAVVMASDRSTQMSVMRALEVGFVDAIFVGARKEVEKNPVLMRHIDHMTFIDADDADDAAAKAVRLVHDGKADILMKGMINTDNLLRAVLNKEYGILPKGQVLAHITATEIPGYSKFLFFTDAAVIPFPTLEQRTALVRHVAYVARAIGVPEPKIAMIHCTEKVDGRHFPYTEDYVTLKKMWREHAFGKCILDGPMDIKTACDYEAMHKKGIQSPINGEADAVIFPDIEAGNVFYKTLTLFAGAVCAGVLQGPIAPCVVASRGDSILSKFYSLALAAL